MRGVQTSQAFRNASVQGQRDWGIRSDRRFAFRDNDRPHFRRGAGFAFFGADWGPGYAYAPGYAYDEPYYTSYDTGYAPYSPGYVAAPSDYGYAVETYPAPAYAVETYPAPGYAVETYPAATVTAPTCTCGNAWTTTSWGRW
jgi:hypothetical protein